MKKNNIRGLTVSAIMGALSFVIMLLAFSIPIVPSFIEFDFSELPALITSFAFGPLYGVLVCLIKNLLHLFITKTMAVGEISNFLLGAIFVYVAGVVYKHKKNRAGALIGAFSGSAIMAIVSVFTNYYIVYPIYAILFMPKEAILGAYKAILPTVNNLWQALIIFNVPFNMVKGFTVSLVCFVIYKKLSPILKVGKNSA